MQNLFWGTGYNVVAAPLAAGVLAGVGVVLSPAVGAALTSASIIASAPLDLNSFANQDLRNADSNRVSSLVRFLDSQKRDSAVRRELFGPQPWFVWKLHNANATPQFLVFEGNRPAVPSYGLGGGCGRMAG